MTNHRTLPQVGDRFKVVKDVERYPYFINTTGMTGTVVEVVDHPVWGAIWLKVDQHLDGAEEWDNCIQWSEQGESLSEFFEDCQPLEDDAVHVPFE